MNGKVNKYFIEASKIQNFIIHEAMTPFTIKFYLAVIVKDND